MASCGPPTERPETRESVGEPAAQTRAAPTATPAAEPSDALPRFRHLTIEDGLSQNAVYALLQDRSGFIWIGTQDGLNRYDGHAFTVYAHDPFDPSTLSSSYVTALHQDDHGALWVGTLDGGLNRLDPATGHVVRFARSPRQHITSLDSDARGDVWVGTLGAGTLRLPREQADTPDALFERVALDGASSSPFPRVDAVLVDRRDGVWAGTARGVYRLAPDRRRFERVPTQPGAVPDTVVTSLAETADGALWVGTTLGLSRIVDAEAGVFESHPFPFRSHGYGWTNVHRITEGPDGRLWCATMSGLARLDPETGRYDLVRNDPWDPESLGSDRVTDLWWDRTDVLWVGLNGYGLDRYDAKRTRFQTLRRPAGLETRWDGFSVRTLFEDTDGTLWISAGTLYRADTTGTITAFESEPGRPPGFDIGEVWGVCRDRLGRLWFATGGSLVRYDPQTNAVREVAYDAPHEGAFPADVKGVFEDREGAIWAVSVAFISRLDDARTGRFTHFRHTPDDEADPHSTLFPSVHQAADGAFWMGTETGLVRFDARTAAVRRYRTDPADPSSLSHDRVRAITPDPREPDRVLWVGTAGGGLNRFDVAAGTFRHVTERDGLPNNVVYSVLPDREGRLWLSTNRGLARYEPATGDVRTFDADDGLQGNEFNAGASHRTADGRLLFGGIYGITRFDPAAVVDNPHAPAVVLTGLRIGDRPVAVGDSTGLLSRELWATDAVRLSHRENMVTFSFAALDYSAPQKNRYAYRMEGFDDAWIEAGTERTATYTNLPPGRYTFRVRGSNNDGVWNREGSTLALTVAPPWWRAWWAWLVYAALTLGAGVALYRTRQNQLRLRHRAEIEHLEAEQLRALDRSRSAFFANVSHEFRTPLTLTLGPLDDVLAGEYGPVPEAAAAPLGLARRSASRVLTLINQILDLSRLEAGHTPLRARRLDLAAFVRAQVEPFDPLASRRRIATEVSVPGTPIELWTDPEHVGTVLTNLLSNAFKFTPEGGRVAVTVTAEGGVARVTVQDTGPGIAAADLARIFDRFYQAQGGAGRPLGSGIGLALSHDLAGLVGGALSAESPGGADDGPAGSAFTLTLPLGREHLAPDQIDDRPWRSGVPIPALGTIELGEAAVPPRHGDDDGVDDDATTILVADDEPDIRAFVRRHLEGAGYRVVEAADGQEALDRARERLPDLVVSDVMMPRLDGLGLCRALRADPETDFVPVLLLTARAAPEDRLDGLAEACDAYLTKPFDVRELVARVDNLIALRKRLRDRFAGPAGDGAAPAPPPPIESADEAFVASVRAAIAERLGDETFTVGALADAVGLSRSHLLRRTTALLGASPSDLIRTARLDRAAELLAARAGTVSEVAYGVGFKSVAHFSNAFLAHTGMRPSAFAEAHG